MLNQCQLDRVYQNHKILVVVNINIYHLRLNLD